MLIGRSVCKLLSVPINGLTWLPHSPDAFQSDVEFLPGRLQLLNGWRRCGVSGSVDVPVLTPASQHDSSKNQNDCCKSGQTNWRQKQITQRLAD